MEARTAHAALAQRAIDSIPAEADPIDVQAAIESHAFGAFDLAWSHAMAAGANPTDADLAMADRLGWWSE